MMARECAGQNRDPALLLDPCGQPLGPIVCEVSMPAEVSSIPGTTATILTAIGRDATDILISAAIGEALLNAVVHGALGLETDAVDRDVAILQPAIHQAEVRRSSGPPILITAHCADAVYSVTIKDPGKGFDWQRALARVEAGDSDIFREGGRGLIIIRAGCIGLAFNETGNQVTLAFDAAPGSRPARVVAVQNQSSAQARDQSPEPVFAAVQGEADAGRATSKVGLEHSNEGPREVEASSPSPPIWQALGVLFGAHPWHGVAPGPRAPEVVTSFIEMVPTDTVKYEIDKVCGLLRVDRPQKYSNAIPTLYGFVPQTLCAERVAARYHERGGRAGMAGDGDPLDICVLCETPIAHGNVLVEAVPIGGLRMIDGDEVDDKIVAVLVGDAAYGRFVDIEDCPQALRERLRHYFLTYKQAPEGPRSTVEIAEVYGREEAHEVIRRSQADYQESFGGLIDFVTAALRG